jgi:hypothetical protein
MIRRLRSFCLLNLRNLRNLWINFLWPTPGIDPLLTALVVDHLDIKHVEDEDHGIEHVDHWRLDAVGPFDCESPLSRFDGEG